MRDGIRASAWWSIYLLLAIGPLPLGLIQLDPGRGFWVNFSVALGFVGLALLGLQFVLAARIARVNSPFGIDAVLLFHRQMGYVALSLVVAHPVILFVWDSRYVRLLNVFASPVRAKLAVASVVLLAVLIATSVWRRAFRLGYVAWQLIHAVLGIAVVVTALLHVLLIGYYVDQSWEKALWIAYSAGFIAVTFWVRIVKPVQRYRRRWRVVAIDEQPGHSHRLILEPVDPGSYGPRGFHFQPGQFAWITTGRSPFAVSYNPFSFSSSADRTEQVAFTIKSTGDFTDSLHDLAPGDIVYLDGPHGRFTADRHEGPGFVLIAGGVGITPMVSILETMADREDRRPCLLFVSVRHEDDIICADQIDALRSLLNLEVVPVVSSPAPQWTGERGRLNAEILDRHLPRRRERLQYFICGSDPLMDTAERALAELGIPSDRVHSERFAMV